LKQIASLCFESFDPRHQRFENDKTNSHFKQSVKVLFVNIIVSNDSVKKIFALELCAVKFKQWL